jgi:hypothetical protein
MNPSPFRACPERSREGATPPCRPPGSWRFFDSYPALTRWANPPAALNGLAVTVPTPAAVECGSLFVAVARTSGHTHICQRGRCGGTGRTTPPANCHPEPRDRGPRHARCSRAGVGEGASRPSASEGSRACPCCPYGSWLPSIDRMGPTGTVQILRFAQNDASGGRCI